MKLTVDRGALVRELQLLRGAVETSTTVPILSHILAEADGESLVITATNLDLAIRCSCAARVEKGGSIALPGTRFLDYVKLLPGSDVGLARQENDWLGITCGRANARMACMGRDSWPNLPDMPESDIEMESEELAAMIARTEFAISREESRFTLDGAAFLAGDAVSLVATDGHRMALAGADDKGKRVLVPRKALALAGKLAAAHEGPVRFAHEGNYLFFQFGERLLISRELTGNFPDYRRVLPKDAPHTVTIEREAVKAAIERVAQFSDEASRAIRITVGAGELIVSASVSTIGESEESVPIEFAGAAVAIGFRADYLLDFLKTVGGELVKFSFTDSQSAGEFRPADEAQAYRYVVMPMRI